MITATARSTAAASSICRAPTAIASRPLSATSSKAISMIRRSGAELGGPLQVARRDQGWKWQTPDRYRRTSGRSSAGRARNNCLRSGLQALEQFLLRLRIHLFGVLRDLVPAD